MDNGKSMVKDLFSVQHYLSCNGKYGCNGGLPSQSIDWMSKNGVTNVCCTPYNMGKGGSIKGECPAKGQCALVTESSSVYNAQGIVSVTNPSSPFLGCSKPPDKNRKSKEYAVYYPGKS